MDMAAITIAMVTVLQHGLAFRYSSPILVICTYPVPSQIWEVGLTFTHIYEVTAQIEFLVSYMVSPSILGSLPFRKSGKNVILYFQCSPVSAFGRD